MVSSPIRAAAALAFGLAAAIAAGQERFDPSTCLPKQLQVMYPEPALKQRIMGVVTTEFTVDDSGAATLVASKGYPLLVVGAETAVRTATFKPACAGRRLTVTFKFRLDQDLDPATPVTVRAEEPLIYEIVSPLDRIIVIISDPPMYGRKPLWRKFRSCLAKLRFW